MNTDDNSIDSLIEFNLSNDKLVISPASRQEMSIVSHIIRTTAEWYEPLSNEEDMKEHLVDEQWEEENFNKRDFYIGRCKKTGDVVGILSLQNPSENEMYIGYLYIHANQVGKRFGKVFLDFAKTFAISKNKQSIILLCHPEAVWAVKAYKKYGFKTLLSNKKDILNWKNGWFQNYYEEQMELLSLDLTTSRVQSKQLAYIAN